MIDSLRKDVRVTLRGLLKAPAFAVVTILTLALAIGANTAIFSVVDAVLLRPLPYPNADHLVRVALRTLPQAGTGGELGFSDRGYRHFVENNRVFEEFGGFAAEPIAWALTGQGPPLQVNVGAVGIVLGLVAAVLLGRVIASLLYGVSPYDVVSLVAGPAVFVAVAALASAIPAARAARIPPAVALRGN